MKTYVVRRATALTLAALCLALLGSTVHAATEAKVPVQTFTLDNGMEFLLVPMPEKTGMVSSGSFLKNFWIFTLEFISAMLDIPFTRY